MILIEVAVPPVDKGLDAGRKIIPGASRLKLRSTLDEADEHKCRPVGHLVDLMTDQLEAIQRVPL